jgi:hypothetical protein
MFGAIILIDLEAISHSLSTESIYNLYRLKVLISHEIENPTRIEQIKNSIQIGQVIEYFNGKLNNMMTATIIEKRRTCVIVRHINDGKEWTAPYYTITLDCNPFIKPNLNTINKHNVGIGDIVGFLHNGNQVIGTVKRINPKTVTLVTNKNKTWYVYYEHLFPVIDIQNHNVIDVELIEPPR